MVMRAYVDGVEIDKIPGLEAVCGMDDWLSGLMSWAHKNRPDLEMDAIFSSDTTSKDDAPLMELWIGGAPPHRELELGGFLKTFACQKPCEK